jgi:hypothetical protein
MKTRTVQIDFDCFPYQHKTCNISSWWRIHFVIDIHGIKTFLFSFLMQIKSETHAFVNVFHLGVGTLQPHHIPHTILLLTWILPSMILYLSYSSSLLSSLVLAEPVRPVDSWQQLYDLDYNLLVNDQFFGRSFQVE